MLIDDDMYLFEVGVSEDLNRNRALVHLVPMKKRDGKFFTILLRAHSGLSTRPNQYVGHIRR